jgi:protein SCO1
VNKSIRLGVQVVVGTVLISACVSAGLNARYPAAATRAGQDLGAGAFPLGSFALIERSGRTVTQADLVNRVFIASFIFTRCQLSCPRLTSVMKGLQDRLAGADVLLVSVSVDPEHDTPLVLGRYAASFGASPDRWWFLTGNKDSIHDLVQGHFKLGLVEAPAETRAAGAEAIVHSDRLALVDRGLITGFFDSTDNDAISSLLAQAKRRALPSWIRGLPSVNASLNALCAVLLTAGWNFIRRYRQSAARGKERSTPPALSNPLAEPLVRAHVTCMLLAVATSAIFLTCYLVYHFHAGSVRFPHGGLLRLSYFTILLSHTLLATLGVVPLVLMTLFHALRGSFAKHAAIAQVTLPIWLYVSITGVVIYLMLYHLPSGSGSGVAVA